MGSVGLVLGGGGVLGQAFHAGVLSTLAEAGWDPRGAALVLGTSAGSQVGAVLRAGLSGPDMAAAMAGDELSAAGAEVFAPVRASAGLPDPAPATRRWPGPGSPALLSRMLSRPGDARVGLLLAALLPEGRRTTERFVIGLDPLFGDRWPSEPLWIPATDYETGRRVTFGRPGSPRATVGQAVAASCAMPGFFAPAVIGERRYADGGCHSFVNLDLLADEGLDDVIVCAPLSSEGPPGRGSRPRNRLYHRLAVEREARLVRRSGTRVSCFQPDAATQRALGADSMDYSRCRAVVDAARAQAWRLLEDGAVQFLG